ncbi:hypothetical protein HanIR_Chr16g0823421 [Helianthus annuus]|nr:hypothetical protein HanIR_Chr16g0823421 [Helianthus annuus]
MSYRLKKCSSFLKPFLAATPSPLSFVFVYCRRLRSAAYRTTVLIIVTDFGPPLIELRFLSIVADFDPPLIGLRSTPRRRQDYGLPPRC